MLEDPRDLVSDMENIYNMLGIKNGSKAVSRRNLMFVMMVGDVQREVREEGRGEDQHQVDDQPVGGEALRAE